MFLALIRQTMSVNYRLIAKILIIYMSEQKVEYLFAIIVMKSRKLLDPKIPIYSKTLFKLHSKNESSFKTAEIWLNVPVKFTSRSPKNVLQPRTHHITRNEKLIWSNDHVLAKIVCINALTIFPFENSKNCLC